MTTPLPVRRYPGSPITPAGTRDLLSGDTPSVTLKAYDGSIVWELMGGRAIPDPWLAPECVQVKKAGWKGLIPPWKTIDQKGATEDGIHFVDALYDPLEVTANVIASARDGRHLRAVVSEFIASIDAKQTSPLQWFSTASGFWWADVRWLKAPPDVMSVGIEDTRQELTLSLRADSGFWRTHDSTAGYKASGGTAFMEFKNPGDQPMFPRFTCFGPGTFKFADGPLSTSMLQFGPLLPGQVAQIRTDPRRRGVVDLTKKPPTSQEVSQFNNALNDLKSFTQVLSVFQSIFGILGTGPVPPQGNMYSLLKGRFSDNSAIPAKSPGRPVESKTVKVEISGGDSNTMILGAATPLRRLPY